MVNIWKILHVKHTYMSA